MRDFTRTNIFFTHAGLELKEQAAMFIIKPLRAFILTLCLLVLSAHAGAQDSIEGRWQGALARDGAVQILSVDFFKEAGALKGKIEMPDMITRTFQPINVSVDAGRIQFETAYGKANLVFD